MTWREVTVVAGHYVVICGYDMETDEFEIRDPASSRYTTLSNLWHVPLSPFKK